MGETGASVVVGVDGSAPSLTAVDLATHAAAVGDRPLRIVHAFVWPMIRAPLGASVAPMPIKDLRRDAEQVVAQAEARARAHDPSVRVSAQVVDGGPSAVLIAESRRAAMVVIGHRGLGGFAGLLLGSVAVQVAAHAASPVVVARGTVGRDGPVVVGVDGSPTSTRAIAFAADQAARRQTSLLAVHAWTAPVSTGPTDLLPLVTDVERIEAQEARALAESVAGIAGAHPDLRVEQQLLQGHPARVLTELSGGAQLVVAGSRGRGGFTGLLLGSISQALIHHADCPVAVIHPDARPTGPDGSGG